MKTVKRSASTENADLGRSVRPFRQGSLDANCGFYAIANAMLMVAPEAFREHHSSSDLLRTMVKAAARICTPEELIHEGMDGIELEHVAKAAIRHIQRKGYNFHLTRPGRLGLGPHSRDPARWLADAAELASVAVILYVDEGDQSHWSVLKSAKGSRVVLFDSDGMGSARAQRCEPFLALNLSAPCVVATEALELTISARGS